MAMGRNLRVFHNLPNCGPTQPYSLIVEQRGRDEILLVENYAIVPLSKSDKIVKMCQWFQWCSFRSQ